MSVENMVLVVVVPLVGERGKGGGCSEYLKTAQIFNQHALIRIEIWIITPF